MPRMSRNMRAFLVSIQSEPGQWTAPLLARDFGVKPSSARRTLRTLEAMGLIYRKPGEPHPRGGRVASVWFPTQRR